MRQSPLPKLNLRETMREREREKSRAWVYGCGMESFIVVLKKHPRIPVFMNTKYQNKISMRVV